jgi:hypothetical protein
VAACRGSLREISLSLVEHRRNPISVTGKRNRYFQPSVINGPNAYLGFYLNSSINIDDVVVCPEGSHELRQRRIEPGLFPT